MGKSGAGRASAVRRKEASRGGTDREGHRRFRDRTEGENYLHEKHGKWWDNLTPGQKTAVHTYTGQTYKQINKALNEGNGMVRGMNPEHREAIRNLTRAIRSNSLPEAVVVYRGLRVPKDFDPKSMVGKVWRGKAFMSTSLDRAIGTRFAHGGDRRTEGVLVRIKVPKGAKAASILAAGEAELTFGRKSGFRVKSVKRDKHGVYIVNATYVARGK